MILIAAGIYLRIFYGGTFLIVSFRVNVSIYFWLGEPLLHTFAVTWVGSDAAFSMPAFG